MRRLALVLGLILVMFLPPPLRAQDVLADKFLDNLIRYLAVRRNMNLASSQGEHVAEIGKIYYIEQPDHPDKLRRFASKGTPVSLFLYGEGFSVPPPQINLEQRYQIQSDFARNLLGSLQAEIKDYGVDLTALRSCVLAAKVSFQVGRRSVAWTSVDRLIKADPTQWSSLPAGSSGLLVPLEQLVVINFKYDKASACEQKGGLGLKFLDALAAKFSAGEINISSGGVDFPAYTTFAFKPYPVKFRGWKGGPG
jgi:hypothetical protein